MPEVDPVTRAVLPLRCMRGPFFVGRENQGERESGKVAGGLGAQLLGLDRKAFRSALGDALGQQMPVLHRRLARGAAERRSDEHTSEPQSLTRTSSAVRCLTTQSSAHTQTADLLSCTSLTRRSDTPP